MFRKGRPPTRVKFRIWGKQHDPRDPPRLKPNMPWQWICPIHSCRQVCKGTYASVAHARYYHIRTKHPEVSANHFRNEDPFDVVATSPHIPPPQRAWSCPLCNHGLPEVPTQARMRALRAHCQQHHPKETPRSLSYKILAGRTNLGVARHQTTRRQQDRERMHGSHTIVAVQPIEKIQRDPGFRGRLFYCCKCFSQLRGTTGHKAGKTCEARQEEMQTNGWALSRKRAWWTNWLANDPLTAESFLQAANLTKEQVAEILNLDNPSDSSLRWKKRRAREGFVGTGKHAVKPTKKAFRQKKTSQIERAAWRHGGKRGQRVGEAAHPGPDSPKVCCVNCQGDTNVWAALRLDLQPDVWLIQETWFTDSKAASFKRWAKSRGFVAYIQNGMTVAGNSQRQAGGVAVLVRKGIPQRFAAQFPMDNTSGIFAWVNGIFVGSVYAPPNENAPQHAVNGILNAMVSAGMKPSNTWFLGGDWNETPDDSLSAEVLSGFQGVPSLLGRPTRYEGSREIDWFISNCPLSVSKVTSPEDVLGDHLILETQLKCPTPRPWRGTLPKGPNFCLPG